MIIRKDIIKLDVYYNDIYVGYLKESSSNNVYFKYDTEWLNNGFSISPISLPLVNKTFKVNNRNLEGLFGVFYDSLPYGWGKLLTIKKLKENGYDYKNLSPLTKLSLTTPYSIGALRYVPCSKELINKIQNLDLLCTQSINFYDELGDYDLDLIYKYGGSSGGARPKVNYYYRNELWIVKFPCKQDGINPGYNEYIANMCAKLCDINVNDFCLLPSKINKGYFAAKRFDYVDNKKIHVVSLSSLLETSHTIPNLDYTLLFQVIKRFCGESDLYEAYKIMCFNIIFNNKDDHGRNFSFIYNESDKTYHLSPFYDITFTPNKLEHEMSLYRNGNPSISDLKKIISDFNLDNIICNNIINKCLYIHDKFLNNEIK